MMVKKSANDSSSSEKAFTPKNKETKVIEGGKKERMVGKAKKIKQKSNRR